MNKIESKGIICLKNDLNIEFRVCTIEYFLYEDNSYKYIFTPNYDVISLLDTNAFQGIPGLNLDLHKEQYIRENQLPTFISERVPSENRENLTELLDEVGLDYINPIEYLKKTKLKYSGDNLYVIEYEDKKKMYLEDNVNKANSFGLTKIILDNLAKGNEVIINKNEKIYGKALFDVLSLLYRKSFKNIISKAEDGIYQAKIMGKYKGRKSIYINELSFREQLELVNKGEITVKDAAKNLGISIDKYYRYKKKLS